MRLVIFDLDGIIVSTDQYHYEAWKVLADMYGLDFDYELNHKLRGVSRAESLEIILRANNVKYDPQIFSEMLHTKNEIYKQKLFQLHPSLILKGTMDLLNDLKKHGIPVAVGSSSKNASFILKQIGLDTFFDVVIDGKAIQHSKPDPEVFLRCASALDLDPRQCVVLEDANAGIQAAINGGMIAIGVGNADLKEAHLLVRDLTTLSYYLLLQTYHMHRLSSEPAILNH